MKKSILTGLFLSVFLVVISFTAEAQAKPVAKQTYKDFVGANPNWEADLKTVGDYVNALAANDLDKAKSLLAENYKGFGPSPKDSATREQHIERWKEQAKSQLNAKTTFVSETFRVLQGEQMGDWVSVWGDWSFTQNNIIVKFPYQFTAHISKGKIDRGIVYYDRAYIMETLGYKITPPAPAQ